MVLIAPRRDTRVVAYAALAAGMLALGLATGQAEPVAAGSVTAAAGDTESIPKTLSRKICTASVSRNRPLYST